MYLQGVIQGRRNSLVGSITAILNFDYSAETIIKAVLLDKKVPLTFKGSGGMHKPFDKLMEDLIVFYKDVHITNELIALHTLRNDVQHNTQVPSLSEINRHRQNVRLFFDNICSTIYGSHISFDSISLSFLVDSKIGRKILDEMENAINRTSYGDAVYYARLATYYHLRLLRTEINVPHMFNHYNRFSNAGTGSIGFRYSRSDDRDVQELKDTLRKIVSELDDYARDMEKVTRWIIGKMPIIEYQYEINELFDGEHNIEYFGYSPRTGIAADETKAERARVLTYHIINGIQSMLKETKDVAEPYIIELLPQLSGRSVNVSVGFSSVSEIIEAKLNISHQEAPNAPINIVNLDVNKTIQNVHFDNLESDRKYILTLTVTNDIQTISRNSAFEVK